MNTPFDPESERQDALALDLASLDQLGRALGRRVVKLAAAVDDAERMSQDSDDVMVVAGAAALARYSADAASDCAQGVLCLIGRGDVALTTTSLQLAGRARRMAARVERQWQELRARKGGAA